MPRSEPTRSSRCLRHVGDDAPNWTEIGAYGNGGAAKRSPDSSDPRCDYPVWQTSPQPAPNLGQTYRRWAVRDFRDPWTAKKRVTPRFTTRHDLAIAARAVRAGPTRIARTPVASPQDLPEDGLGFLPGPQRPRRSRSDRSYQTTLKYLAVFAEKRIW